MTDASIFAWQPVARPLPVARAADRLPDLLQPDLDVVFVGTAAGRRSADIGHYYTGAGNRFWSTLHHVGITRRAFAPEDDASLMDLGIGFTDLSKVGYGADDKITKDQIDLDRFERSLRIYQPRAIAFTGKKAASLWLKRRTDRIRYGSQRPRDNLPQEFVLCSPSGAARRYWRLDPWHELADWLRATRPWRF
ncbi:MAG: mismatch-specific DNA-glycosylase [Hyphomicrobium sp.]